MRIKALKTFRHGSVNIRRGSSVDMTEARARELMTRGLATEEKAARKAPADDSKPKADVKPPKASS